jgi:hypothetical protein
VKRSVAWTIYIYFWKRIVTLVRCARECVSVPAYAFVNVSSLCEKGVGGRNFDPKTENLCVFWRRWDITSA